MLLFAGDPDHFRCLVSQTSLASFFRIATVSAVDDVDSPLPALIFGYERLGPGYAVIQKLIGL